MSRQNIAQLGKPHRRFDVASTPGFETFEAASHEDAFRAKMLRCHAMQSPEQAQQLRVLAETLDPRQTDDPQTTASSRYMRQQRRNTLGPLWEMLHEGERAGATTGQPAYHAFHIVPEGFSVPIEELLAFDVQAWRARIRNHLNRVARAVGGMPHGALYGCLHGAYDPRTRSFSLHMHGVAESGKAALIDGLRSLRMYRPAQPGDGRDAARKPVMISRSPLVNMPAPLTYVDKSYWPLRLTRIAEDGLPEAVGHRTFRINDPAAHNTYLLFLDRWSRKDLTMLMGLQVVNSRLIRL